MHPTGRKTHRRRPRCDRRRLGHSTPTAGVCPSVPAPTPGILPRRPKSRKSPGAYVDAGSRIILTNTFGANRFILARHHLADQVAEVNRAGVEISRRAAAGHAAVFASVGPTGIVLMMGGGQRRPTQGCVCRTSPGHRPRLAPTVL